MGKRANMVGVCSGMAAEAHAIRVVLERNGIPHVLRGQTVPVDTQGGMLRLGGIAVVEVLVSPGLRPGSQGHRGR